MVLPEIPKSYLIALSFIALVILRALYVDSFTSAGLGLIIGYLISKHYEDEYATTE